MLTGFLRVISSICKWGKKWAEKARQKRRQQTHEGKDDKGRGWVQRYRCAMWRRYFTTEIRFRVCRKYWHKELSFWGETRNVDATSRIVPPFWQKRKEFLRIKPGFIGLRCEASVTQISLFRNPHNSHKTPKTLAVSPKCKIHLHSLKQNNFLLQQFWLTYCRIKLLESCILSSTSQWIKVLDESLVSKKSKIRTKKTSDEKRQKMRSHALRRGHYSRRVQ